MFFLFQSWRRWLLLQFLEKEVSNIYERALGLSVFIEHYRIQFGNIAKIVYLLGYVPCDKRMRLSRVSS